MNKLIKYFYYIISVIFLVLTFIEIIVYMRMYSNLLGIIYLFLNFFILFLLITISFNYEKANKKIRISKVVLAIIIGIISSFVISLLIPSLITYTDSSFVFEDKVFLISKVLKPILYLTLLVLCYFEIGGKFRFVNRKK